MKKRGHWVGYKIRESWIYVIKSAKIDYDGNRKLNQTTGIKYIKKKSLRMGEFFR